MERLIDRVRPGTVAVFKQDVTPYSPSEDQACPWTWDCRRADYSWCGGGSGMTWRQAMDRGRGHAERVHGVTW